MEAILNPTSLISKRLNLVGFQITINVIYLKIKYYYVCKKYKIIKNTIYEDAESIIKSKISEKVTAKLNFIIKYILIAELILFGNLNYLWWQDENVLLVK